MIVYRAVPGGRPAIVFQGAYADTFHRIKGQWHLNERHVEIDGIGETEGHVADAARPVGSVSG